VTGTDHDYIKLFSELHRRKNMPHPTMARR
jgi:hypothetical protein